MPWVPESDPMVTVTEYGNFSVTIQYYELVGGGIDPGTGLSIPETPVYYNVTVTPQLTDPSTISITGNGTKSVTISGYYGPCFNDQLKAMLTHDVVSENNISLPNYRDYDTLTVEPKGVGAWTKFAQHDDNFEIVSFIPDATRTRDIYYTCVSNGNTVTKYNRVQDLNWTPGMEALNQAILATTRKKV